MAVTYEIRPEEKVVTVTITGEIDDRTFVDVHHEIAGNPAITRDFALLVDLREAHGERVTSAGVRALVQLPLVLSPTSRRAVVVPTDLGFGVARMYESRRGDAGAVVPFRDIAAARRWVGLDRPEKLA
jgi:hypothetical protein